MPFDSSLDAIAARIRELSELWQPFIEDPSVAERDFSNPRGTARGVVPIAQAIHHADDHRTQVLSIIGARGLEVPDLDIWAYGAEAGFVRYKEEAAAT